MSMVKMVEEELKMEVRDDIKAANITAIMAPRMPTYTMIMIVIMIMTITGINSVTSFTKAMFVHPARL